MFCIFCFKESESKTCPKCQEKMKILIKHSDKTELFYSTLRISAMHDHILEERARQIRLHGVQSWPFSTEREKAHCAVMLPTIRKECEIRTADKSLSWFHIAIEELYEAAVEKDPVLLFTEIIETITVLYSAAFNVMDKNI